MAVKFLKDKGYSAYICKSENEARKKFNSLILKKGHVIFLIQFLQVKKK